MQTKPLALLSVTDKTGITDFASALLKLGYELLSTGGTAKLLKEQKIPVTDVASYADSPEIFNGRVKTLHPKIHGGILYDRNNPEHVKEADNHNIRAIDLVVVNLYNFKQNAQAKELDIEEAIEFIDIGGPTMLRAAAKNWEHCTPIIDPNRYDEIIKALSQGPLPKDLRLQLSAEVFAKISQYDSMITSYFKKSLGQKTEALQEEINLTLTTNQPLRYGENPHQEARLYQVNGICEGFTSVEPIQGKALSYNNLMDLDAATGVVHDFPGKIACTIIKHTNPCGTAVTIRDESLESVYRRALTGDPKSAFGGIVACNETIDLETAKAMNEHFLECIAAPDYTKEALEEFAKKKNLRVIKTPWVKTPKTKPRTLFKSIMGGILAQTEDIASKRSKDWLVATKKKPTEAIIEDLDFAMTVATHVKSNTIVYAKGMQTITVGAGQMSRIDAAEFAAEKAKEEGKSLEGAVLASDAFFPFNDVVLLAAKYGIKAIIQPGGSRRDQESIDACNEHGIVMMFSGERHFKH